MKKMREDVDSRCGCEAVAVTCNTAHFFMEKVAKETQVSLIHMPEETAKEAVCQAAGGKIAILATRGTIQTGLYQKRLESHGGHPFVPSEEIEALVMSQIYDRIKKGLPARKRGLGKNRCLPAPGKLRLCHHGLYGAFCCKRRAAL